MQRSQNFTLLQNIVGNGEDTGKKHFSSSHNAFYPIEDGDHHFSCIFFVASKPLELVEILLNWFNKRFCCLHGIELNVLSDASGIEHK